MLLLTKRTLRKTQAAGLPPLYLTPTEVGETPTAKKCETNPICRPASFAPPPFMRNEPKIERPPQVGLLYLTPVFQPGMPHNPKKRNEPNLPHRHYSTNLHSTLYNIQSLGPIYPTASIPSAYNQQSPYTITTKRQKKETTLSFFPESGISSASSRPSLIATSPVQQFYPAHIRHIQKHLQQPRAPISTTFPQSYFAITFL